MAFACRASTEAVEARVPVDASQAIVRNGDLPAVSAGVGIGCREDPQRYSRQEAALQLREKAVDLAAIGTSGTVGHIHHIPMVVTGWRVGVIALGRCANIGPIFTCSGLCCGGCLTHLPEVPAVVEVHRLRLVPSVVSMTRIEPTIYTYFLCVMVHMLGP